MAFLGYASILRESAFACLAVAEAFVWLWCAPVWIVEGDGFPNLAVAAAAAVAVASEGEVGAAVMAAVAAASEVDGTRSQAGALAASFAGLHLKPEKCVLIISCAELAAQLEVAIRKWLVA